jgi:3-oxoisoapionate kinase
LTLAGIRTALFIRPPTPGQLRRFPDLQAVGVAGMTRSLASADMKCELTPALKQLKALGVRHVHYKVCSTFDSSPSVGSIGCVLDVAARIFHAPFVPLLVAAPGLGRHCVFGNLFAQFGIGSNGEIHRLDRHPSISKHPITPMIEADLRLHLGKQTRRKIELFDILQLALPEKESRAALRKILAKRPDGVLFDALYAEQLGRIGGLIDEYASVRRPLFSVGSSGIETALAAHWANKSRGQVNRSSTKPASAVNQILVGSGSCSPVTEKQIAWAMRNGFAEVAFDAAAIGSSKTYAKEIRRAMEAAIKLVEAGRSVIVHTTRGGPNKRIAEKFKHSTARVFGTALGVILREAVKVTAIKRVCIAGGDTSSFAARAIGIEALEMLAPLTPGAPLCRVRGSDSFIDGLEIIFKGGQVGAENYFSIVRRGKI